MKWGTGDNSTPAQYWLPHRAPGMGPSLSLGEDLHHLLVETSGKESRDNAHAGSASFKLVAFSHYTHRAGPWFLHLQNKRDLFNQKILRKTVQCLILLGIPISLSFWALSASEMGGRSLYYQTQKWSAGRLAEGNGKTAQEKAVLIQIHPD